MEYVRSIGFERTIVTHVNAFLDEFTPDVLDKLVSLGAMLEISNGVLVPLHGRQDPQDVAKIIRQVGADHIVLVSDAGQLENPSPPEALRAFCHILIKEGISPEEIEKMIVDNPTRLLNLEPIKEEGK
jgi:predicted metal-dependent TIM-barrel fold hydrolase